MIPFRSQPPIRRSCSTLFVLVGCLVCPVRAILAATTFRITGTAVSSRDGAPLPHCKLTLRPTLPERSSPSPRGSADTQPLTVEADDRGRFLLQPPSAGAWQLSATARGFRTQLLDQHEQFSSAVILTAAAPAIDLVVRLDPDAAITGVVLDEAGEPVRNATVQAAPVTPPDVPRPSSFNRGRLSAITDDRGRYEISGLAPGDFHLSVQARPWYAFAGQAAARAASGNSAAPESPLDVVYPPTWFPGVTDPAAAGTLSVAPGEAREADFNLNPLPSTHLVINAAPAPPPGSGEARIQPSIGMERLGPEGLSPVDSFATFGPGGHFQFNGLTPGLYRLHTRQGGGEEEVSFLRVAAGSPPNLDAGTAVEAARVRVKFNGAGDAADRLSISLVDVTTGTPFRIEPGQGGFRRRSQTDAASTPDRILQVPEGRYELFLTGGGQEIYLGGITLNGIAVTGRLINVRRGDNLLNLSVASGRASVRGIALLDGRPVPGAMVLLVPTGFGDPASIQTLRRDQTNTDGSFSIPEIIPGQYILAVIKNGWTTDWRSGLTLERYLLHGVPLSLKGGDAIEQKLDTQQP